MLSQEVLPHFVDSLKWRAVYHDGDGDIPDKPEMLYQIDPMTEEENRYEDIDRFKLGRFDIIDSFGNPKVSVFMKTNRRLIYRKRTFLDAAGRIKGRMLITGWVETVSTPSGQKDLYSLIYIHPDGTVALDNHRENLELRDVEM